MSITSWLLAAAVGLWAGCFANIVIARLPFLIAQNWRREALTATGHDPGGESQAKHGLLSRRCPACEIPTPWVSLFPILSWTQRGRLQAACCEHTQYPRPLVELAAAGLALMVAALYGATWEGLFVYGACLALLTLAVIDLRTLLLPDIITLPLMWAGFLYHLTFQPNDLHNSVMGAMAGYLVLWSVYWSFKLATGKEGMGYGDFKLLAAIGAWVGWQPLPLLLILSAAIGLLIALALKLGKRSDHGPYVPFGPSLAFAGWIALLTPSAALESCCSLFLL